MRKLALIDGLTGEVCATVTCVGRVVSIDANAKRRQSWERGILFRGREVTPADGELFLDALLGRYSRTSYLRAVEQIDPK